MNTEWKELKTIQEVSAAQAADMEIEFQVDPGNDKYCPWKEWKGNVWCTTYSFRARPRQPKTMKVVSLCWRHTSGRLIWGDDKCDPTNYAGYQRFPAGDIPGKVEA